MCHAPSAREPSTRPRTCQRAAAFDPGLVIEVVADDPDTSAAVLALARSAGLRVAREEFSAHDKA